MKLLVDAQTDKVIGASMCGPDAPEIMQACIFCFTAAYDLLVHLPFFYVCINFSLLYCLFMSAIMIFSTVNNLSIMPCSWCI